MSIAKSSASGECDWRFAILSIYTNKNMCGRHGVQWTLTSALFLDSTGRDSPPPPAI